MIFEPLSKCNNLKELIINNREKLDEGKVKNLTELKTKNLDLKIIDENDNSIHNFYNDNTQDIINALNYHMQNPNNQLHNNSKIVR